jgi:acyl CoA:acetate/3-ketoacid CoA transferase
MDIKIAQQMTITELVLENQKMKLDAQREAEHHDRMVGELEKVYKERDEAREQIKELIYIAERAIALAEIDFENDKFGVVSELRDGLEKIKEESK